MAAEHSGSSMLDSDCQKALDGLFRSASSGPKKITVAAAGFFGTIAGGPLVGAAAAGVAGVAADKFGSWFAMNDNTMRLLEAAARDKQDRAQEAAQAALIKLVQE